MKPPTYLFSCPQMKQLAEKIAGSCPAVELAEIQWKDFEDGFPNIKIEQAKSLRNKPVFFLASFETPGDIFKQLSVIYELPRLSIESLTVVLPFYPTGTMERVEEEGEVATASTLARMLSNTPNSQSGPLQVVIFDIHALQERFYFSDNVIPRLETAVPLLIHRIQNTSDVAIAFPDEGAWKRFGKMFDGYPLITCHKVRENQQRVISIKDGEPAGKHVVIVDDLIMTGGTIRACRQALKKAGAAAISAYVTHGVFPKQSWKHFVGEDFETFWITDSCPGTAAAVTNTPPFEVLTLQKPIRMIIEGTDNDDK